MTEDPISGANAGTQDVVAADLTSAKSPEAEAVTGDFSQFGLSRELLQAITEAGYQKPTPIQAKGIPPALLRKDLIGIAQTGTGKTASFALPMIELLSRGRARARMPRSLILEPTRELAAQVAESFEQYTKYHKLSMALLIGGTSFDEQDRKLDRGADVLIATPGRLLDHFERGKLMLSQTQILVIDEADRMLDMGFIPDIERICKLIPFTRQTLFYSATMPAEIRRLTEQFLQNPVEIEVSRPATTGENITQTMVDVPANDWAKREALRRLISGAEDLKNAIVFCNRKHDVDVVARSLKKHGFNAAPLHGDLDQSVRMQTLDAFRSGEVPILVASDVAARGLDIPDVSHVFNFDVPFHSDDYVHRIGRTGRAGRSGATFMLVTPRDEKYVDSIEKLIKQKPEHIVLEGLAESIRERPPRRGHDGRRDRDRGRGRNRDRNRSQTEDIQTMQPKAAEAARSPEPVRTAKPAGKSQTAPVKKQNRNLPRSQQPFGADLSQLPAFLLRPVPLPKTYTRLPEEEDELAEELAEEEREVREVRDERDTRDERKSDKARKHSRRRGRKNRSERPQDAQAETVTQEVAPEMVNVPEAVPQSVPVPEVKADVAPEVKTEAPVVAEAPEKTEVQTEPKAAARKPRRQTRKPRKAAARAEKSAETPVAPEVKAEPVVPEVVNAPAEAVVVTEAPVAEPEAPAKKTAKKTTRKAATKKATTKKAAAKPATKKAATKKATSEKAPAKKTTRKAATKKATTEKAPAKKTTKKAATKKAATEKAPAKKTAKKAATKKATTKTATAKKAPAKAATKKAATKTATAKKTTRKRVTKKAAVSAD